MESKPPIDIESALDLVLGSTMRLSHHESQQKLGDFFLGHILSSAIEKYKDDEIASKYLYNLQCTIFAAIRGMAVGRDMFYTKWEFLKKHEEDKEKFLDQLAGLSPLNVAGWFWRLAGLIAGAGILQIFVNSLSLRGLGLSLVSLVAGVLLADVLLKKYRDKALKRIRRETQESMAKYWEDSLRQYKEVLKKFLIIVIKLREEYYPELKTLRGKRVFPSTSIPFVDFLPVSTQDTKISKEELEEFVGQIVDRHLSLQPPMVH